LLRFDVAAAVPPGARIDEVRLILTVSRAASAAPGPASLHRALEDWGEALSNAGERAGSGTAAQPGDATWSHRFFPDVEWSDPGAAFAPDASWSGPLGGIGSHVAGPSAALASDVQAWLDSPSANAGWVLRGDETAPGTAQRLDSRESGAASRPALAISFTPDSDADGVHADETQDGRVTVSDLVAINQAIFDPVRATPLCDTNADDRCDVRDILGANRKIFGAQAFCSRYPPPP
jgi:hypothetical protein